MAVWPLAQAFKALKIQSGDRRGQGYWQFWFCAGSTGQLSAGATYTQFYHVKSGTILRSATYRAKEDHQNQGEPFVQPKDLSDSSQSIWLRKHMRTMLSVFTS